MLISYGRSRSDIVLLLGTLWDVSIGQGRIIQVLGLLGNEALQISFKEKTEFLIIWRCMIIHMKKRELAPIESSKMYKVGVLP
jgi:hypothetical protein